MDNILEKLSEEKKENYIEYLNLMSSSCNNTSKKLIPFFAVNRKRILDVGCGSGILVKNIREIDKKSYILGIDLNINAVRECKKQKIENTEFLKISLEELKTKVKNKEIEAFDCIIFSSVLHEFSSYADKKNRYSKKPIEEAISIAKEILNKDGIILIRDGLKETSESIIKLQFKNKKDIEFLNKFKDKYHENIEIYNINNDIFLKAKDLKEFLFTYTWDKESFKREVKEQFGILSKRKWKEIIRKENLKITTFNTYPEEYVKYLSKKIEITNDIEKLLKENIVFIVAKKGE